MVDGGSDPGKRCENGYAWLPTRNDAAEVSTSQRAKVVLLLEQSLHECTDDDGIQNVLEYLMVCTSESVTLSNSISLKGGGSREEFEDTGAKSVRWSCFSLGDLMSKVNMPEIMEPVDSVGGPYNTTGGDSRVMFNANFGGVVLVWLRILVVGLSDENPLGVLSVRLLCNTRESNAILDDDDELSRSCMEEIYAVRPLVERWAMRETRGARPRSLN